MTYQPGSTVTLKESRYKNEDSSGSIEFLGWNTKADGSGTAYQPGDKITIEGKDLVLYAQWDGAVEPNTETEKENLSFWAKIIDWFKNLFR